MRSTFLLTLLLLFTRICVFAQGKTFTVEQCRILAVQNSPVQQKKLSAASISDLQIRNLKSNALPRIQVGAQASWQSDVFGLPFKFPGSDIPEVPKDQYKLSMDVAQRIWDGGSDHYLRQQRELERDLASVQVDIDAFAIREIVTDLYFKALLLQESDAILVASQKDLESRLKQAEAAVSEGIALRTAVDQIKIQILKTQQQVSATRSDYRAVLEILAKWVGQSVTPEALTEKSFNEIKRPVIVARPEYALFILQQRGFQIGKEALELRAKPRIEAFAQGGLGRPNPFNFFETGFNPFVMVGLRAAWTPFDWGNKKRESQVFDLQMNNLGIQRQLFDQRLEANTLKDQQDEVKWMEQLEQDKAIIALQADIVRRAEAQVKNGVMTFTDYLTQLNLLTQAQLAQKTHEIQAVQSREMQKAKSGG
jgi:outer membrane protein TolC